MKKILGKVKKSLWLRLLGIILLFVLLAGILLSAATVYKYQTEGYYDEVDMQEKYAYSAAAKAIANHYMDEIYEDMISVFPSSGVCMVDEKALEQYLGNKNVNCKIVH